MDGAARDALILAHAGWARRVALGAIRRHKLRVSPDDAMGAAFLALVEAAGRYRPGKMPFDGYAYQRIAGAVQDFSNRETASGRGADGIWRYRLPEADVSGLAWRLQDAAPGPFELAVAAEDARQVESLLRCAMPRERAVLLVVYFEGLPLHEAARRLGVSEARACQLAAAGIKRMRTAARRRKP